MIRLMESLIILTGLLVWMTGVIKGETTMADMVLMNGKIYTVEAAMPWAEALAVRDGKLMAVGSNQAIKPLIGAKTQVLDLKGRMVVPGFNDAHLHFADGGFYLLGVDLREAKNEQEFIRLIKDYVSGLKQGEWVTDGNWDHERWPSQKHPRKELIDSVTGDNPVLVQRLDGHIALANSAALKLAGITAKTPNPQGGEIDHDSKTGKLTGLLKDNAIELVTRVVTKPTRQRREEAIRTAMKTALSCGITSVQDNASSEDIQIYQSLLKSRELKIRVNAWRNIDYLEDLKRVGIQQDFGSDFLKLGTVKLYVDGSMGAGTALYFEPYQDDPSTAGIPIYSETELDEWVRKIDQAGLQIAVHAIGDKANTWILNAFQKAFAANGNRVRRHRIEHAQCVTDPDLNRYRELGIIASIQPSHCIDDMHWAEKRIGERCRYCYRMESFVRAGVSVAFGTDFFVEPLNPMLGIYAAVTREFVEGGPQGGWYPDEKMSLESAIYCYTMGSAYAEFQENVKGSLAPGKWADLVVLDHNLFEIPHPDILKTKALMTMVNGMIVYTAL